MQKDLDSAHHGPSTFEEYHEFLTVQHDIFQERGEQQMSLRDLLTLLFKHKKKMLWVFIVTFAAVTAGTFLTVPTYEAQSTLLVKFGREFTYRPEVTDKAPVVSVNQEEAMNSEINIMTSRDLIERVVKKFEIKKLYPDLLTDTSASIAPLDAAILQFGKALKVEVLKKTNVLQVSFRHQDRAIAAEAVNLLVECYKEMHFQVYNGPESEFLQKQLSAYQQKLKDSEDSMQNFKQSNMVYSLDEQRGLLLRQRSDLDAAMKATLNRIQGLKERVLVLKAGMKELAQKDGRYTQTERDKIIVDAKAQLLGLQLKERDLLNKYPESNRLVANVRKDIAMVDQFLKQQEQDISGKVKTSNSVYQQAEKESLLAEADLKAELAKERILKQQLAQIDSAVSSLDSKEKPLQNLSRAISTNEKNYRIYLDRLEEALISNDMNRQKLANLSVIQHATPPAKPIKPKKAVYIAIGFILGAASALGCAILAEYTNQSLSTPEDAQKRLKLPVLATVTFKQQL